MTGKPFDPTPPVPGRPSIGDLAYAAGRAALGAIPGASVLAEPILQYLAPPLDRRRTNWLNELAEKVDDLQRRGACPDWHALGANEAFVSAVAQAAASAQRTHLREKHEALRNAILNTALGVPRIDDELRAILLHCIDELQPSHLVALKFLAQPERTGRFGSAPWTEPASLMDLLAAKHEQFGSRRDVLSAVIADLKTRSLVKPFDYETSGEAASLAESCWASPIGLELLALVRAPA